MSQRARWIRLLLPLGVLAGGGALALLIYATRPTAPTREQPKPVIEVDVWPLVPTAHQVVLHTQGVVAASMRTELSAQVEGAVTVHPAFERGALVEAGALLAEVDPTAYALVVEQSTQELTVARAALAEGRVDVANATRRQAITEDRLRLQQEQLERTRKLRATGVASIDDLFEARGRELAVREAHELQASSVRSLTARQDRLAAEVEVATQRLARAQLDLSRTRILAPYRARIVSRAVGSGQFVSRGATLGVLYDVERLEVSLSLTRAQVAFLDLPAEGQPGVPVTLALRAGGREHTWQGSVSRAEGVVDRASRQLSVIAQLTPESMSGGQPSLRPGDFVSARIQARKLERVFELPRAAAQGGDAILVVDKETQALTRRPVRVVWRTSELLVADGGVEPGELLCLTPLTFGGGSLQVKVRQAPAGDGTAK